MSIERREGGFTEPFDHLQVINYLQDSESREIEAFDEATGEIIILTLNFNQEVCIKKGNNLILVGNQKILIPKLESAKTNSMKGNTEESKNAYQYNLIAQGLNAMVNSVLEKDVHPEVIKKRPSKSKLNSEKEVSGYDWITKFNINIPVYYQPEDLADLYIESIMDSLKELELVVTPPKDENDMVLLATEGFVKNEVKVMNLLNKMLREYDLEYIYHVKERKLPFIKLVVWKIINE